MRRLLATRSACGVASSPRRLLSLVAAAAAVAALALPSAASAQATRTWVSGVGDDVNPCSRTAPCKTFAGAISKTAAAGEINVLDPGGFGAVTITKSITISATGTEAGVLVSGANGFVINAGANDRVVLRGLDFEGLGTGLNAINFLAGGSLTLEDSTINNFGGAPGFGVNFTPANNASLSIRNSVIRGNLAAGGGAINLAPSGSAKATATIADSLLFQNTIGIALARGSTANVIGTTVFGTTGNAFQVSSNATAAQLNLIGSFVTGSGGTAVKTNGTGASARIHDNTIVGNTRGLNAINGSAIVSLGTNAVIGNVTNGNPTSTPGLK